MAVKRRRVAIYSLIEAPGVANPLGVERAVAYRLVPVFRSLVISLVSLAAVAPLRGGEAPASTFHGDPFGTSDSDSASTRATGVDGTPIEFDLPEGLSEPDVADDYPLTQERVTLGHALFYDGSLSRNGRIQCGSCHRHQYARSDGRQFAIGIDGGSTRRNAMPLFNLAWKENFFWDGRAPSLREQVLMVMQDPLEMDASLDEVVRRLANSQTYRFAFKEAYGTEEVTAERIAVALEQFLQTRVSTDSRFDQSLRGEITLTEIEERGRELFMNEHRPGDAASGAGCARCHGGPLFTDHAFRNNGLAPTDDLGREEVTGDLQDRRTFVTPSLRNVALSAPYMHDGRFATLAEVVEHYSSGLHSGDTLDPGLAEAAASGGGLNLSRPDQAALVAFLEALSDPAFGD